MKTYLKKRGVIAHNTVAAPLRPLSPEEEAAVEALIPQLAEPVAAR